MNYNEYNIRYNFHIKSFHSGEKEYRQWSILSVHRQKGGFTYYLAKEKLRICLRASGNRGAHAIFRFWTFDEKIPAIM